MKWFSQEKAKSVVVTKEGAQRAGGSSKNHFVPVSGKNAARN
jgi:hypothetical protein